MNRIAVLHLLNALGDSSLGRIVQRIMGHLGREGYDWHVGGLAGSGNLQEEFRRLGAQVVDFSDRKNGSVGLARGIRHYISDHQIRIVHTQSPRARLAAAMALAGTRQTLHLATEQLLYAPGDRRWGLLYTLVDRFTLYLPDHLVAVSHRMRRQLATLPGLSANRITTVHNAIDCEAFHVPGQRDACRLELGLLPESQVIGYAGRIDRVKRLEVLLKGFARVLARYPRACLLVIGDGQQRPELEALAVYLGVSEAVIWTGFRQDVPRLLAAMDIYVQPSANEGFSLSILEAMAAGKPVIATGVGGEEEVITDQESGMLIPLGSPLAIETAVADLLDHPEKRSALGQVARRRVAQQFDALQMADAYGGLYELLASRV